MFACLAYLESLDTARVWTRVQPSVRRRAGLPVVFYFDKDSFPASLVNQKDFVPLPGCPRGRDTASKAGGRAGCSILPTKEARNAEAAYRPNGLFLPNIQMCRPDPS